MCLLPPVGSPPSALRVVPGPVSGPLSHPSSIAGDLEVLENLFASWKVAEAPELVTVAQVERGLLLGTAPERQGEEKMKRTPQPTLTQSRLTGSGMLKIQGNGPIPSTSGAPPAGPQTPQRDRSFSEGDSMASTETFKSPEKSVNMDTSTPEQGRKRPRPQEGPDDGMREFFLQALKINKEEIIKSFQTNLGELSKKVERNACEIIDNKAEIAKQNCRGRGDRQETQIEKLTERVRALENRRTLEPVMPSRAVLSDDYMRARRSVRAWPVEGTTEGEIWGGAGDFLHGPLAIPESDLNQNDVEAVTRVDDSGPGVIRNEVIIRFKDARTRDMVMASSVNLASCVDETGRPTAGTRLELPSELMDTFRLLARFGTRLRARHGEGTRRHIKFDDYAGSLYANIKLPGDSAWTRVTPDMAKEDLVASMKEENAANQKRLASKLIPGPRERLQRPAAEPGVPPQPVRAVPTLPKQLAPSGKRPRWSGPARRHL